MLDEISEHPEEALHPLQVSAMRLFSTDDEPSDVYAQAAALEKDLVADVQGLGVSEISLDLLRRTREAKAKALTRLGKAVEAADVLEAHLREVIMLGGSATQVVGAGAAATLSLLRLPAVERARKTWNAVLERAYAMHPCELQAEALASEIRLLALECRLLRAQAVASRLINQINEWTDPFIPAVAQALNDCVYAFPDGPEGLALIVLSWTLDPARRESEQSSEHDESLAYSLRYATREKIIAASISLANRLPLCRLGLSKQQYFDELEQYLDQISRLKGVAPLEGLLGASGIAALIARRSAGCRMSEVVLATLRLHGVVDAASSELTRNSEMGRAHV